MRYLIIFNLLPLLLTAQIYSGAEAVAIKDGPNLDAFSRLRVSNSQTLFDAQLTYDLQPLLYEQITAETGATITHDATNRNADLAFSSTPTGGKAILQTFEHFRYQPSKSQLIFITFNMQGGTANVTKFAGYSDGNNGIEFYLSGSTPGVRILSDSDSGDESITQANWNLHKLNWTTGDTLDLTKTQILVIDFQALYVGRVRIGFDIDGIITYVHQFNHANLSASSYIQTANLPVRIGMTSTGTVTSNMDFICTAVVSEGGQDLTTGYTFSATGSVNASSGARTHLLSIRPDTLFNGKTNRSKIEIEEVSLLVTGNFPVKWELCLGQEISGANSFLEVNSSYSAMDYNTSGTLSGSPAIVIATGYVASSAQSKASTNIHIPFRYPISLNAEGQPRSLGTLTLIVTGINGASACQGDIGWKEIR